MLTRRLFLSAAAGLAATGLLRRDAQAAPFRLKPMPARLPLIGAPHPETALWTYNGSLPGPLLRLTQGNRLRVEVVNGLEQETTVHWHGVRLPNAMDGVPDLTQEPIKPGGRFTYEFACEDAGTFWYHPHWGSAEQIGRGLYGVLIVDEKMPPVVDRDIVWALSDLRLNEQAQITEDFRHPMDVSHAGRIGNTALLNGRLAERFALRAGERIRLRLLNMANARIFHLRFEQHRPWLVALDGHPVPPRQLAADEAVVLGPGMRADLILDATGEPGGTYRVLDSDLRGSTYRLVDLAYGPMRARQAANQAPPSALAPNPVPEPDLAGAERLKLALGGGAMGGLAELRVDGRPMGLREAFQQHRVAWALNGVGRPDRPGDHRHGHAPLFSLSRGKSYIFEVENDTAWPHPMHLHGHAFRVLSLDGSPLADRPFRDTVLINPRGKAELAFVADNPGDWMLHCHILEHQAGGMMATVRVA